MAHWLDAIVELYESRFLPLTVPVALEAGRLLDRAIGSGVDAGFEDAAIAATASVHDLTVVTENTRHFQAFGVPIMPRRARAHHRLLVDADLIFALREVFTSIEPRQPNRASRVRDAAVSLASQSAQALEHTLATVRSSFYLVHPNGLFGGNV